MSSLFPELPAPSRGTLAGLVCVLLAGLPAGARAAEYYNQPTIELSSAYNTNIDLDTNVKQGVVGYYADASSSMGVATPNAELALQPRLLYNYYPTVRGIDRLEGFLGLQGRYNWQRDALTVNGFYDHRDDLNAEQPTAAEPVTATPGVGTTTPNTGHFTTGVTRDWLILDPTFRHLITPLSSIGISGEYQRLSFNNEDTTSHIPFNYYMGRVFYAWQQNQRTDFELSAFGSKYFAGSIESQSSTGGVTGRVGFNWTSVLSSQLTASYERAKLSETDPHFVNDTSNQWAATFSTVYNAQISQYRLSIGRVIIPGAAGGLFATDQIQGQYDHDFSPRLHFVGAVRAFRDRTLTGIAAGTDTRNYVAASIKARWMMTRTLYIAGSYAYFWQKYQVNSFSADANKVTLTFGYAALPREH